MNASQRSGRWRTRAIFLMAAVPCVVAAYEGGVWAAAWLWAGDRGGAALNNRGSYERADLEVRTEARSDVAVLPANIDLGVVRARQALESPIQITNRGDRSVKLDRFESSCPCVQASLAWPSVRPGETVPGLVQLDLEEEPNFTGDLAVTVKGLDEGAQPIVEFSVKVAVRR